MNYNELEERMEQKRLKEVKKNPKLDVYLNYDEALVKIHKYKNTIDKKSTCHITTHKSNGKYIMVVNLFAICAKMADKDGYGNYLFLDLNILLDDLKIVTKLKKILDSLFDSIFIPVNETEHSKKILLQLIIKLKLQKDILKDYNKQTDKDKIIKQKQVIKEYKSLITDIKNDLSLVMSKEEIKELITDK